MHHGNIDVRAVRAAIIADVDEVEVVVSHHERATLRVGDDVS
jgi:hypothetical protein